eukprot:scaffold3180_cov399-Prasinococcus_capsulatus_cf.AAC.10
MDRGVVEMRWWRCPESPGRGRWRWPRPDLRCTGMLSSGGQRQPASGAGVNLAWRRASTGAKCLGQGDCSCRSSATGTTATSCATAACRSHGHPSALRGERGVRTPTCTPRPPRPRPFAPWALPPPGQWPVPIGLVRVQRSSAKAPAPAPASGEDGCGVSAACAEQEHGAA